MRRALNHALLRQERRWAALPDQLRLARGLGGLAVAAAAVGALTLPFLPRVDAPLAHALIVAGLFGGLVLVRLPARIIETVPSLTWPLVAIANQTAYVFATGDADSPFLAGFTAIVLVTAATATLAMTFGAVALAAAGLFTTALTDALISPDEVIRLLAENAVLLAVAYIVSRLAWQRRLELERSARRHARMRGAATRYRLASELDQLTGIGNRRAFEADLASLQRTGALGDVSLLMADADGLKRVNDAYGHAAGDRMIQGLTQALIHNLRPSERLYRIGGDEFAAILRGSDAAGLSRRIGDRIEIDLEGVGAVSASIGLVAADTLTSRADLAEGADRRMYQSKKGHRIMAEAVPELVVTREGSP